MQLTGNLRMKEIVFPEAIDYFLIYRNQQESSQLQPGSSRAPVLCQYWAT